MLKVAEEPSLKNATFSDTRMSIWAAKPSSATSAIANIQSVVAKEGLHAEILFQDTSNGTTESDRNRRRTAVADPSTCSQHALLRLTP